MTPSHGQLGAYIGPHVADLPTFVAPGDIGATYRRLATRHAEDVDELGEFFDVISAFAKMETYEL